MDLIQSSEVIESVERFVRGRRLRRLTSSQYVAARRIVARLAANPVDLEAIVAGNVRPLFEKFLKRVPAYPSRSSGRGIVICAGGPRFFPCAWVLIRMLRYLGCRLPVELWYLGPREMSLAMRRLVVPLGVSCVDALRRPESRQIRRLGGWELKPLALACCRFQDVLLLDADNVPVRDPEYLFDTPELAREGALFWPDSPEMGFRREVLALLGMKAAGDRPFESGQVLVDKKRCWSALQATLWMNQHSEFFHPLTLGDKETFRLGFHRVGKSYAMPRKGPGGKMRQYDFQGRLLFQHRNTDKWNLSFPPQRIPGFRREALCRAFLEELRQLWTPPTPPRLGGVPADGAATGNPLRASRMDRSVSLGAGQGRVGGTVVTLFDRAMSQVGAITSRAWRSYAEGRGYHFVCHEALLDPGRHPAWNKIRAVLEALEGQSEWVLWVDADTLPMNFEVGVESLLPVGGDLAFASDFNGLNTGVFLVRATPWARHFLETAYFLGDVRIDPDGFGDKWEQNTIKAILQGFRQPDSRVVIHPERVMNSSLASYEPGDFLIHLGGMSNTERLERLASLCR